MKDLLKPTNIAEFVIHVDAEGRHMLYASKVPGITPELVAKYAEVIIRCGMEYAQMHGITMHINTKGTP